MYYKQSTTQQLRDNSSSKTTDKEHYSSGLQPDELKISYCKFVVSCYFSCRSTRVVSQKLVSMFKDGVRVLSEKAIHVAGVARQQPLQESNMAAVLGDDDGNVLTFLSLVQWNGYNRNKILLKISIDYQVYLVYTQGKPYSGWPGWPPTAASGQFRGGKLDRHCSERSSGRPLYSIPYSILGLRKKGDFLIRKFLRPKICQFPITDRPQNVIASQ